MTGIGWVYDALRDKRRALGTYDEALAILREVGNAAREGLARVTAGTGHE